MKKRFLYFCLLGFVILLSGFLFYSFFTLAKKRGVENRVSSSYIVKKQKIVKSYQKETDLKEVVKKREGDFFSSQEANKKLSFLSKTSREKKLFDKPNAFAMKESFSKTHPWEVNALAFTPKDSASPKIALIIDDLGVDARMTRRTFNLKGPLALSFLPYGEKLGQLVLEGKKKGHEIMLHLPMEPHSKKANAGPHMLKVAFNEKEIDKELAFNLDAFKGYVAVNNHMGSRFTANHEKMRAFFRAFKRRGVFFVDSKTSDRSVCACEAIKEQVPFLERDVFIDHIRKPSSIRFYLEKLERIAKKRGSAIGIGHPSKLTLDLLEVWIPTLEAKGIELVPISYLMQEKLQKDSKNK